MPPEGLLMTREDEREIPDDVQMEEYLEEYVVDATGRSSEEEMLRNLPVGEEELADETYEVTMEITPVQHMIMAPLMESAVDSEVDFRAIPEAIAMRRFLQEYNDSAEELNGIMQRWQDKYEGFGGLLG